MPPSTSVSPSAGFHGACLNTSERRLSQLVWTQLDELHRCSSVSTHNQPIETSMGHCRSCSVDSTMYASSSDVVCLRAVFTGPLAESLADCLPASDWHLDGWRGELSGSSVVMYCLHSAAPFAFCMQQSIGNDYTRRRCGLDIQDYTFMLAIRSHRALCCCSSSQDSLAG